MDWEEILKFLLSHPNKEIQYRGTVIVYFLVSHDKTMAARIIDTHCKVSYKYMCNLYRILFLFLNVVYFVWY